MAKSMAACSILVPCAAFVPQLGKPNAAPVLRGAVEADTSIATSQTWTDAVGYIAAPSFVALAGAVAVRAGLGARASRQAARSEALLARRVVGISPPLGGPKNDQKWDPLNLGNTEQKMKRYAEVEIKHGRISMLACLGYFVPEIFRFPGCENFKTGLGALESIPSEGWVQLILFIGAHELLVKPRAGAIHGMDFGLGTELLEGISDEELERKQTAERNNGRLAMAAIIGLMWQDGTFGQSPIASIATDGLWGPTFGDRFVQYIPQCNSLLTGRIWC